MENHMFWLVLNRNVQDTTTWYIDLLIVDHPNCRRSKDYYIYSYILSIKLAGIISWINALMIPIKIGWKGADFSGFFPAKRQVPLPVTISEHQTPLELLSREGWWRRVHNTWRYQSVWGLSDEKMSGRSWILVEDAQYLLKLDEISMRSTSVVENDAQIASWLDSGSTQGGAPPCTVLVGLPTFHC